jgi:hypothetical protein
MRTHGQVIVSVTACACAGMLLAEALLWHMPCQLTSQTCDISARRHRDSPERHPMAGGLNAYLSGVTVSGTTATGSVITPPAGVLTATGARPTLT